MKAAYQKAARVLCRGTYIADLDTSLRVPRVMSESAMKRFLEVRKKWDPDETFPGYIQCRIGWRERIMVHANECMMWSVDVPGAPVARLITCGFPPGPPVAGGSALGPWRL